MKAAWPTVAVAVVLAGCSWRDPLVLDRRPATIAAPTLRPFADGVHWVLERDLVFAYPDRPAIRVPAGFVTDLASVPAAAQSFRSRIGTYSRAAVLHDWLYWTGVCPRAQADRIMLRAMLTSGSSPKVANQVYQAVKRFGQAAYDASALERRAGLRHSVPADRFDQLDDHDWAAVRAALGPIKPPAEPEAAPAFCAIGDPEPGER